MEDIDNIVIQIVVNFGIASIFAHQHRRRAAKWLNVNLMGRKMRNDPRGKKPLATMPTQKRTARHTHHINPLPQLHE